MRHKLGKINSSCLEEYKTKVMLSLGKQHFEIWLRFDLKQQLFQVKRKNITNESHIEQIALLLQNPYIINGKLLFPSKDKPPT